jgi:hypothetical protein
MLAVAASTLPPQCLDGGHYYQRRYYALAEMERRSWAPRPFVKWD